MKLGASGYLDFGQLMEVYSVSVTQTLAALWQAGYTNSLIGICSSQQSFISTSWVKTVLERAEKVQGKLFNVSLNAVK